jgi:hypothetical protein
MLSIMEQPQVGAPTVDIQRFVGVGFAARSRQMMEDKKNIYTARSTIDRKSVVIPTRARQMSKF